MQRPFRVARAAASGTEPGLSPMVGRYAPAAEAPRVRLGEICWTLRISSTVAWNALRWARFPWRREPGFWVLGPAVGTRPVAPERGPRAPAGAGRPKGC